MPTEKLHYHEILAGYFLPGDTERIRARLQRAARGAWPEPVRDVIRECARHMLETETDPQRRKIAELMICYSWWGRAVERGIAARHFEEFMRDHLERLRTQASQRKPVDKWARYE